MRVACAICRDPREVPPSKVRRVQLCRKNTCRREAKTRRLIPPGGRPRRPVRVIDGRAYTPCVACHNWRLETSFAVVKRDASGAPLYRASRCPRCRRERDRENAALDRRARALMAASAME